VASGDSGIDRLGNNVNKNSEEHDNKLEEIAGGKGRQAGAELVVVEWKMDNQWTTYSELFGKSLFCTVWQEPQ
jgi:hypothetical protein